jgi:CubicO group peptidase (beta-lactamase class C family)
MDFAKLTNQLETSGLDVYAFEIFRDGETVYNFGNADLRYPIYSATKSFTSAAVGIAESEGVLSADSPIYEFLEQKYLRLVPQSQVQNFKKLTFKRFMTMSVQGYPFRPDGDNWLEFALSLPIDYSLPPKFGYSNIPALLVGAACENAVGGQLVKYLTPRLFEPLGISNPTYLTTPCGHFYGASGMQLSLRELSRFGRMLLQKGSFGGRQLVGEKWINAATSRQIENSDGGYGYFFWTNRDGGFSISGKWGQKCLVYPDRNLMITYLSHACERSGELLKIAENISKSNDFKCEN